MPPELESRLEQALAELPDAAPEVEARARRAALAAVPGRRRGQRVFGAAAVAVAGAGLAALSLLGLRATGTIHLQVGSRARVEEHAIGPRRLLVPAGAEGIAAVIDGRLWLSTRRGVHIEGLPVSAAGLSPHALYVGVGLGRALVAMAPDRRLAWTHATPGTVTAVAWAPDGLRVAYIVRSGNRYALRMIEGDGDHDRLLDASVRAVRPTWRADSLALAYVGGGGRAVVLDLAADSRRVLTAAACGPVRALAFADRGRRLAVAGARGVGADGRCLGSVGGPVGAVAWAGRTTLVAATRTRERGAVLRRIGVAARGLKPAADCAAAPVHVLATWAGGVAVAGSGGAGVQVRSLTDAEPSTGCAASGGSVLLALPAARRVTSLDVR